MSIAEKIKVLIVDDQVTSRLLLSDALTQLGFKQITAAGDGTRRVVAGELKVRAPLVAGRVEQAIVSGLDEYLQAEAPTVDRYLAG